MNWYEWILLVLELPVVWFIWTALHELSHVAVAKMFLNIVKVNYWLYPHYDNNNFYFARVQYFHDIAEISRTKEALIYLAPRFMNLIAAISFVFFSYFPVPWNFVWLIFWGAGLVDFIVGSLGISPYSDLRKASEALQISPDVLRVCGFLVIALSIILGFVI